LLASGWYAARLAAKQKIDRQLWLRHVDYLDKFLKRASHADEAARLGVAPDLERAKKTLAEVESSDYVKQLVGTLGAESVEAYL